MLLCCWFLCNVGALIYWEEKNKFSCLSLRRAFKALKANVFKCFKFRILSSLYYNFKKIWKQWKQCWTVVQYSWFYKHIYNVRLSPDSTSNLLLQEWGVLSRIRDSEACSVSRHPTLPCPPQPWRRTSAKRPFHRLSCQASKKVLNQALPALCLNIDQHHCSSVKMLFFDHMKVKIQM